MLAHVAEENYPISCMSYCYYYFFCFLSEQFLFLWVYLLKIPHYNHPSPLKKSVIGRPPGSAKDFIHRGRCFMIRCPIMLSILIMNHE